MDPDWRVEVPRADEMCVAEDGDLGQVDTFDNRCVPGPAVDEARINDAGSDEWATVGNVAVFDPAMVDIRVAIDDGVVIDERISRGFNVVADDVTTAVRVPEPVHFQNLPRLAYNAFALSKFFCSPRKRDREDSAL